MTQHEIKEMEASIKTRQLKALADRYVIGVEALKAIEIEALELLNTTGAIQALEPEALESLAVMGFEISEADRIEAPDISQLIQLEERKIDSITSSAIESLKLVGLEAGYFRESIRESDSREAEVRYKTLVEQLARNYGVANSQLRYEYLGIALRINKIWFYDPDGVFGSSVAKKRVGIHQIENIVRDVESKCLADKSRFFFEWETNKETQIERQREFYSEFKDPLDFSISLHDINVKIRLKPTVKTNSNGTPIGTQPISLPHVDTSKLHLLDRFYLTYGNLQCIYKFDSGKEIKINVQSRKEGLRIVNQLLKVVRPDVLKGSAAKNCIFSEHKKGIELAGKRANSIGYWIYHPDGSHTKHSFEKAIKSLM